MTKWGKFFSGKQPNEEIINIWFKLFFNVVFVLVPFVFVGPVSVTLVCAFVVVASLSFHFLKWRIYGPLTYALALTFVMSLRSSLPHGSFSGEFFASLFALLTLFKTFNLRTYGDGTILLTLLLGTNSAILLMDSDSSILVLLWSFAACLLSVANLLRLNLKNFSSPALLSSLKAAAQAALYTLPLLIFLFYIFQRFSHTPFYYDRGESLIGLSRSLEPGKVSHLTSTSGVAFRARLNKNDFPFLELYWKGQVLSEDLGLKWKLLPQGSKEIETPPKFSAAPDPCIVEQTIYVQRFDLLSFRFALDAPLPETAVNGTPYKITSDICERPKFTRNISSEDLRPYLKVEGDISPELRTFALELRGPSGGEQDFERNLFKYFKEKKFKYTLTPAPSITLDHFLFKSREGFCEHFAAAFATLARLAKIPSRLVTGFQGGEYNRYGDFWTVSYRDAHAWVEVWDNDSGWRRVDPTAIVAPSRLSGGAKKWAGLQDISDRLHLEVLSLLIDAGFFWLRGLFDHRETLISLDDLTFSSFHLAALVFVLACWIQVRRMSRDYSKAAKKEFIRLSNLLEARTIHRGRGEGYDDYRKRLVVWLDGQKNLRPLSSNLNRVFEKFIELRYSATGLNNEESEALYREIKTLQRALKMKTNVVLNLFRRAA